MERVMLLSSSAVPACSACAACAAVLLCLFAVGAEDGPKPLAEDRFEAGKLDPAWTVLRESPGRWRLREGGFEVRVEPGDANSVRNALLRDAPDRGKGRYAVEVTVTNLAAPTKQWEQAGIVWYIDSRPVLKLMKELVDGKLVVVPNLVPMDARSVRLRLTVGPDGFVAEFRPLGDDGAPKGEFKEAGRGALPAPKAGVREQVSIQCYHGPEDAEHWIRFDDFRVTAVP